VKEGVCVCEEGRGEERKGREWFSLDDD